MPRRGPARRFHAGWVELVLRDPGLSRRERDVATLLVEHSSYYDEKHNLYAMNRAQLASWLRIKHPENVRRYVAALIKAGWLVVCEPGHNGRQQTYHRSIPWDSVRSWNRRWHPDCPICHFKRALPDNPDQALTCGNICDLTK